MFSKILNIFTAFMILVYFAAGFFIIFADRFLGGYPSYIRILFGVTIVLYAFYRLYIFIMKLKKTNNYEKDF